jgi:hypothetical protein
MLNVPILIILKSFAVGFIYFGLFVPETLSASHTVVSKAVTISMVVILPAILYPLMITMLLRLSFLDPGYLKRKFDDERFAGQRICLECESYQPPGFSHCSDCRRCVIGRERHCVILGCCVTRRNFQVFMAWLTFSGLSMAVFLACTFSALVHWIFAGNLEKVTFWQFFFSY